MRIRSGPRSQLADNRGSPTRRTTKRSQDPSCQHRPRRSRSSIRLRQTTWRRLPHRSGDRTGYEPRHGMVATVRSNGCFPQFLPTHWRSDVLAGFRPRGTLFHRPLGRSVLWRGFYRSVPRWKSRRHQSRSVEGSLPCYTGLPGDYFAPGRYVIVPTLCHNSHSLVLGLSALSAQSLNKVKPPKSCRKTPPNLEAMSTPVNEL